MKNTFQLVISTSTPVKNLIAFPIFSKILRLFRLFCSYLQASKSDVGAIEWQTLRKDAHSLKGSSSYLAAKQVSHLSLEMQHAAEDKVWVANVLIGSTPSFNFFTSSFLYHVILCVSADIYSFSTVSSPCMSYQNKALVDELLPQLISNFDKAEALMQAKLAELGG